MQSANNGGTARYHGLDAVRAGALLLGVFGHAMLSFFPDPSWVADDYHVAPPLIVAFFSQHIFRMSLFFLIAGFFSRLMVERYGVDGFIRNRLKRIGLVFLVFWPLMLVALVAVAFWAAGYAGSGPLSAPDSPPGGQAPALPAPPPQPLWRVLPLGHTWFLYFLMWLYAGALVVLTLSDRLDPRGRLAGGLDRILGALARTHLLPFVLALPLTAVFVVHEPWTLTSGIRNADFGVLPAVSAFVGFGTAFGFGWFVQRQPVLLELWRKWWWLYLVVALALTTYCSDLMGDVSTNSVPAPYGAGPDALAAAAYPLALWAWCLGLIGAAVRFLSAENRHVRYLADASYWVYLLHLPVVVALQVWVSPWTLAWPLKYALIMALALPLLFGSYQLCVRKTWLGAWLNGRRYS
jgi:glucan biosynthesis protein C